MRVAARAELVQGEQSQRVAQDDGHTTSFVGLVLAAHPTKQQHERDQPQVRLGLAAAGGEVDQIRQATVGVGRIHHRR